MKSNNNLAEQVATYIVQCRLDQLVELTITDLTRCFQVSKPILINHFKKRIGTTPGKFILREKMNRAIFLMARDHQLTVKKLSENLGFCKCDYFIEVFKNHFGLPPNKYREIRLKTY